MTGDHQVNLSELRARAQRAIAHSEAGLLDGRGGLSETEIQHLVEELRIYQAELEIQNEQLIQAQSQIASALERYRTLFDYLPLPGMIADSRGFIVEANRQATECLGLSPAVGLHHASLFQLFDYDSRPQLHRALQGVAETGPHTLGFLAARVGNGATLPCDAHIMHLRSESVGGSKTLVVLVDRSADIALRESEHSWRSLADSASALIWTAGVDGSCEYFNRAWHELTGLPPEASPHHGWIDSLHPDDRERCTEIYATHFERRVPFRMDYRLRRRDGEYRWIRDNATPRFDSTGRFAGYIDHGLDITDWVEAEAQGRARAQELQIAKHAADAANAAKSAFLANMSHEIRTPLNAVLGLTQILEKGDMPPDQHEMVRQIRAAGRSLLGILNDILDISRIEAGQLQLEERPFSLAALLNQIESLLETSAADKGLRLTVAAPAGLDGRLIGDPLRLEQVLVNLVSNAIKFTDSGAVRVEVVPVDLGPKTVRLRFEIGDTGIGIAPETLARLFTPFTQADGSITRRFGGTGLGLSICKRLVASMGGEISVESELGRGSRFRFELSFPRTTDGDLARAAIAAPAGARLAGLRVLVVDDSATNLQVVERMLALEGAHAVLATDGQQAVDRLKLHPDGFDAVLMDVQMPGMDGLTATRSIRREPSLSRLPVIAVTAGVLLDEQQRAQESGMDDLLPKPVDLEQLVEVLLRRARPGPARDPAAAEGRAALEIADAAGLPDIAGIAPERVAFLARGDTDYFRRLLRGFVAESRSVPEEIRLDLESGANSAAAERLHRLRGAAANLGALDLARAAGRLEEAIKRSAPDLPGLMEEAEGALGALLDSMAPWLTEPPLPEGQPDPLDLDKLARLADALGAHRLLSAQRLFAELRAGLVGQHGEEAIRPVAERIESLRFAEALQLLNQLGAGDGSP